jgi:Short C-terminal domain
MLTSSFTDPLAPSDPLAPQAAGPRRHPGRVIANLLAGVVTLGALAVFEVSLVHLLETGTCASGGPYVSARQCPSGTGAWIAGLALSIFVGLISSLVFVATARGKIGWGSIMFGAFFTVTAVVAGYAALFDDRAVSAPGAQLGGLIVAGVFLPMGLIPLVLGIKALQVSRREGSLLSAAGHAVERRVAGLGGGGADPRPPGAVPDLGAPRPSPAPASPRPAPRTATPTPPPSTWQMPARPAAAAPKADPLDQLAKLAELRGSGVLTEAEFQAQKAKLLGEV